MFRHPVYDYDQYGATTASMTTLSITLRRNFRSLLNINFSRFYFILHHLISFPKEIYRSCLILQLPSVISNIFYCCTVVMPSVVMPSVVMLSVATPLELIPIQRL
jgi:hypothetical protein